MSASAIETKPLSGWRKTSTRVTGSWRRSDGRSSLKASAKTRDSKIFCAEWTCRNKIFMKRCPECSRNYTDDTLSFCLEDGTPLVYIASDDEPATAILQSTDPSIGPRTQAQIYTTDQTAVLLTPTGEIVG